MAKTTTTKKATSAAKKTTSVAKKTTSVAKKTTTTKATAAKKTTTAKPAAKKTTTAKPAAKKTTAAKATSAKIGGEITVNGNKIMKTLQKEFSKKFEYLTLCFIVDADREKCVNVRGINTDKRLSEVRKKVSNKELSIHGRSMVKTIENFFWEELGIACQIGICNYMGHAHYFRLGDFNIMSLTAANEWAKEAGCKKVGLTEINQICRGSIF